MHDSSSTGERTHAADNQVAPLTDYNLFETDSALRAAVVREGAGWAGESLRAAGAELGRASTFELARLANRNEPILHAFSPQGERIDAIEFHPSWHALLSGIAARGYHSSPWCAEAPAGAHAARAAGYIMQAQLEGGSLCPTTMTYGAIAALRRDDWFDRHWVPKLTSRIHDPRDLPLTQKSGGLVGMGMTEKQGGSDVRANTTTAQRLPDGGYVLNGHKWFFSAPQCDGHLVLAQASAGLTCFVVPRITDDGKRNGVLIQRLKDKLGNRSNASAEVEFDGAWARILGDEGKGVRTILETGTYTRLDCVIGTAGMMRQCVVQALHHAARRYVFGKPLLAQPLMRSVLADLALEAEAACMLAMRLARSFDHDDLPQEVAFRRIMTSAAKFWVCKRGPDLAGEAMEVFGGNGYVEEAAFARIYREMPVNSIWEGSGNVMCLDVMRALARTPEISEAIAVELTASAGLNSAFDAARSRWTKQTASAVTDERLARRWTQDLVLLVQAAILLRSGRHAVADSFCASRLADVGAVYGAKLGIDSDAVLADNDLETK